MKTNPPTYLFALSHPSEESARLAIQTARTLQLRVPAQHGIVAIEVVATPEEAGRLFECGLFCMKTSRAVQKEHLGELSDALQTVVSTWNHRFSAAYRRAKQNKEKRGLSWADKRVSPPAPYSIHDPADIIPRWKEEAVRRGLKEPKKVPTTRITWKESERGETAFEIAVGDLRKLLGKDYIPEIRDLLAVSPKADRHLFFDVEWLKILIELILHATAGDEPACRKMHGRVSVGVVFVNSSRRGGPRLSASERNMVENEIRSGLSWLVSEHPDGNLTWVFDIQTVSIDVADQANQSDSDSAFDAYWRQPAMAKVAFAGHTYDASDESIVKYRDDMRAHHRTQIAVVVFVTRFGTSWHAYSNSKFIVLSEHGNDWGGWGASDLNFICAHEMCHQFGARDEYSGSGTPCDSCDDLSGCDQIPNGNCEGCARPAQECVMRVHEPALCAYTRGQIGWADIFVELFTDDDWWSGTDDDVELDIGFRTFNLDTNNHDDRERNNREGYALWAGGSLPRSDIRRVLIRKSGDGFSGGWKLARARVFHAGAILCDKSPDAWLEDRRLWRLLCTFDESIVNRLQLRVHTGDVSYGGTDDDVTLRLAGRNWDVDSDADDFERNSTRTYELDPRTGIRVSDLSTITIRKSSDGIFGGWRLGGLRLTVNGVEIYRNDSINRWLEDNDLVFSDGI